MIKWRRPVSFLLAYCILPFIFTVLNLNVPETAHANSRVLVLEVKGVIGPALSEYIQKGLTTAQQQQANAVILRIDTPGGLDKSMREIIKAILASPIPVASFVAPGGSRAASAGTYILYASHIAAMTPATNLGAATPISLGRLPKSTSPSDEGDKEKPKDVSLPDTLQKKIINDAEAYIKALATKRGRNSEWAAKSVTQAESLTAKEALRLKVIDIVADNIQDLLIQMDSRKVNMVSGQHILQTQNPIIAFQPPDWRTRLLMAITDPNIAYIMLLLGIYGLIFEMANPGFVLPGVIGAISIVIALYTFQVMPINYAGLLLLIIGMAFMVAEAFAPSFGALGAGGIIAFITGSIILMDEPSFRISIPIISATAFTSAGFLILIAGRLLTIRRKKIITGEEQMLDSLGQAMEDFDTKGRVRINGESWLGRCSQPVKRGQTVKVTAQNGLILDLELVEEKKMIEASHALPIAVSLFLVVGLFTISIKVVREYQRLVVFFLGRFQTVKKPGLRLIIPGIQQAVRVDLRVITMDVPSQDVISKDNVTVRVNAVLYFRVVEPEKAIIQVEDYFNATSQLAQTTLRSVLGQHELDEMLSEREKMNADLQEIIDKQSDAWGIKVTNVEIKHVDLNDNMIRAIAKQAEAERERRAKVIHAEGELQASEKLLAAANIISQNPQALQLRYLQTLNDISNENASTIVFPLPIDTISSIFDKKTESSPNQDC